MKSFSQFIIEKSDPTKYVPGEEEASERLVKKLVKKSKKGNIPDKNNQYADPEVEELGSREGRKDATDPKKGGYNRDPDDVIDAKKPNGKPKLDNTTKGGSVKSNKPQQKPLGRLVQKVTKERKGKGLKIGDLDYRDSSKLEAQRKARIDTRRNLPSGQPNPKYGKATPKGVENFAQNRGGYGRGRKLSGDEWKKISGDAKKIASDPSSKAYKDIESKINQNRDYGGKRAQVMNPKQVAQVNKEISKSKTVNTKGGKLNIPRTSKLLDTSTRKGRIANVGSPPTPPDPSFRKSVKGPGSSTGSLSKGNLKFSGDSNYNKLKQLIKNTDGRSTNRPKPTPKNFETFRQGNLFGGSSETSTNPKNQGFKPNPNKDDLSDIIKKPKNHNPDQGVLDFDKKTSTKKPIKNIKIDTKYKSSIKNTNFGVDTSNQPKFDVGDKVVKPPKTPKTSKVTSSTGGQKWQGPTTAPKQKITFKNFLNKTNRGSTFSRIKSGSRGVTGKLGAVGAAVDAGFTWKGERAKGRSRLGATLATAAKVGSSILGGTAGAFAGGGVASVATGIAGSVVARTATDTFIDKVFKPKNAPTKTGPGKGGSGTIPGGTPKKRKPLTLNVGLNRSGKMPVKPKQELVKP